MSINTKIIGDTHKSMPGSDLMVAHLDGGPISHVGMETA